MEFKTTVMMISAHPHRLMSFCAICKELSHLTCILVSSTNHSRQVAVTFRDAVVAVKVLPAVAAKDLQAAMAKVLQEAMDREVPVAALSLSEPHQALHSQEGTSTTP